VFDEIIARGEATFEHPANAHGEATLATKLNAHGEMVYKCSTNSDKAMLVARLNACREAAYEHPTMHTAKLRSNELAVKS